ncbi:MAG: hypothetical protein ACRDZX_12885, partial [Acidimicrobiales bacterium]
AQQRAGAAQEEFAKYDLVRQEHEMLVVQGKAARADHAAADQEVADLSGELAALQEAEARSAEVRPLAAGLPAAEKAAQLVAAIASAAGEVTSSPEAAPPAGPDEQALAAAGKEASSARTALGEAEGRHQSARADLERANEAFAKSAALSGEGDCPLCGQSLGDAFAQVQAHRATEVRAAEERAKAAGEALARASASARSAVAELDQRTEQVQAARRARASWEQAQALRMAARERLSAALAALGAESPALAARLGTSPGPGDLAAARRQAEEGLSAARQARDEASRLQGRLERRPAAEGALRRAQERSAEAAALVAILRDKVKALRFDPAALVTAGAALRAEQAEAKAADGVARVARLTAAQAKATAQAEVKRWHEAQAQHAHLAGLESSSVHLSRTAELLNAFRNSVVASVGPRLAVQAAELFGELTDGEYDRLEVDTDTYGLQICDGGISYDLERFSGSEVDLANLALRVAISEHVRFQSGGTVGLLVLDEVFGPLDEERRGRMLLALERLRGRFRQILVVTHSTEIKEQLPHAVEVLKKPGRRATARVVEV